MDTELARAWINAIAASMNEHKDELTELDSAIGDGDHGANMSRGFTAVVAALDTFEADTVGKILVKTGSTLISKVGGASGPLYGSMFRAIGKNLTSPEPDADEFLGAVRAGVAAVQSLGAAVPGDKTMIDACGPALDAFDKAIKEGGDFGAASSMAAHAAEEAARATIPLVARKGRASYLGQRSAGHQDPGATSAALVFAALASVTSAPPGP